MRPAAPSCYTIATFLHSVILLSLFTAVRSAEIRRLSVPRWVRNGTSEAAVLDCDYVYNENDLRLVVKWFFNDDLEPLYQWIPELGSRHVAGPLYGRLDWDFSVKPFDPYSRYRALKIKTPGPELSGKYTCLVTSMAGQDSKHQYMTVYVPARSFRFTFVTSWDGQLTFTCIAEEISPEPRMQLFTIMRKMKIKVDSEPQLIVSKGNDTHDVFMNYSVTESALDPTGMTIFECILDFPHSPYRRAKRITYFPGRPRGQHWLSDGGHAQPPSVLFLVLISTLVAMPSSCSGHEWTSL